MRVAVIGAGIAGLTCARELQQAGVDVHVFERNEIVGGRMSTRTQGGLGLRRQCFYCCRIRQVTGEDFTLTAKLGVERTADLIRLAVQNLSA